ncbi:hypothetical protein ACFFX0_08840 [Citricoccus parietis]|uniref:Uncharacterized protein n=1 Tax=Citricoccus parietis TaxID=592307 RepID=A0ABV5FX90_9MICC
MPASTPQTVPAANYTGVIQRGLPAVSPQIRARQHPCHRASSPSGTSGAVRA